MTTGFKAIDVRRVRLRDRFWSPQIDINRTVTLQHQQQMLEQTGRLENLRRCARGETGGFVGQRYNDSDVYKWIEAAATSLMHFDDPALTMRLNQLATIIQQAQRADGYLNSYIQLEAPTQRWRNLGMGHELYCAGHLIEAAIALERGTGNSTLVTVAVKLADHLCARFGGAEDNAIPGHQEVELALVALSRHTGNRRYQQLALAFLQRRGCRPSRFDQELQQEDLPGNKHDYRMLFLKRGEYHGGYAQDHLPVQQQTEATGHAVRALYQACAMADLVADGVADDWRATLTALWNNTTQRRMYVTGGVGSSRANEGFTHDFDLPCETAYAETCASVAMVLWAHRMLQVAADGSHADVMERALYNGVLAGFSRDGRRFFYENPLASSGDHHRQEWFDCSCCPPNGSRLLQALGGLAFGHREQGLAVHLYLAGSVQSDGWHLQLTHSLPWNGSVQIQVLQAPAAAACLWLRQPDWCDLFEISVNDHPVESSVEAGYQSVHRSWQAGDSVHLQLSMPVKILRADPRVASLTGRVAIQRGPLLYCFEEQDQQANPHEFRVCTDQPVELRDDPELMDGALSLLVPAMHLRNAAATLYSAEPLQAVSRPLKAVPYFLWDNRKPGRMAVWLPEHHS